MEWIGNTTAVAPLVVRPEGTNSYVRSDALGGLTQGLGETDRHPPSRDGDAVTVLPDVLGPGLKVVFCGTAVGTESAQIGTYYAGLSNQFWSVLYRIGLTPRQLAPQEFYTLSQYGIGLMDLFKKGSRLQREAGGESLLQPSSRGLWPTDNPSSLEKW